MNEEAEKKLKGEFAEDDLHKEEKEQKLILKKKNNKERTKGKSKDSRVLAVANQRKGTRQKP